MSKRTTISLPDALVARVRALKEQGIHINVSRVSQRALTDAADVIERRDRERDSRWVLTHEGHERVTAP